MSHRHLSIGPDGKPDDRFNDESLRGKASDIGWTPPPIRVTRRGVEIAAIIAIAAAIFGYIFNIGG